MTVRTARRHLPKGLKKLSDEQVTALINRMELFAEIFIDVIEAGSKKQLGVIDSHERKDNNGK